jgi:hypothetical protein
MMDDGDAPPLVPSAAHRVKESRLSTPCEAATPENGYNEVASKLRSVTIHPLALELARQNQEDGCLFRVPGDPADLACLENLFFKSFQRKDPAAELTKDLTKYIADNMKTSSDKHIVDVSHYEWEEGQGCIPEILVQRRVNMKSDPNDPAVLLIEVSISPDHASDHWWQKADQTFMHVRALLADGLFRQPMLVAVMTLSSEKDLASGLSLFRGCRLGVFLAIPKGSNDYRTALIWHIEFRDDLTDAKLATSGRLNPIAGVFTKLIADARLVTEWNTTPKPVEYKCLGPHCCRYGNRVRTIQ